MIAVVLATPPLVGWGRYGFVPGQSLCFCQWRTSISYTFFMIGTCFGGPCAMMAFSYTNIWRLVRQSKRRINTLGGLSGTPATRNDAVQSETTDRRVQFKLSPNNSFPVSADHSNQIQCTGVPGISSESNTNHLQVPSMGIRKQLQKQPPITKQELKAKKDRRNEMRLTTSFLVVIMTFVICWLPYCVAMFWSLLRPVPRAFDITTLLLGYFNSCCNPIIYGILNKNFRKGYKALLFCESYNQIHSAVSNQTTVANQNNQ